MQLADRVVRKRQLAARTLDVIREQRFRSLGFATRKLETCERRNQWQRQWIDMIGRQRSDALLPRRTGRGFVAERGFRKAERVARFGFRARTKLRERFRM